MFRASRGVEKISHAFGLEAARVDPSDEKQQITRRMFHEMWLQMTGVKVVDALFRVCELPVKVRDCAIEFDLLTPCLVVPPQACGPRRNQRRTFIYSAIVVLASVYLFAAHGMWAAKRYR